MSNNDSTKWRALRAKIASIGLALLSLAEIGLPYSWAQLEYNGGYVQTHREDRDAVSSPATSRNSVRPAADASASYFPDHDFYYPDFYYWSSYSATAPAYRSYYPGPTKRSDIAVLIVHLPEHAVLWVEGKRTRSMGQTRYFQSPPLQPGQKYIYRVRAAWIESGRWISQTREIPVQAGMIQIIDFGV